MDRDERDRAFRQWLTKTTDLSPRAVGDVLSRLRRVERMIDVSGVGSEVDLSIQLLGSGEFRACAPSVRSQLKRAGKYYLDFVAKEPEQR